MGIGGRWMEFGCMHSMRSLKLEFKLVTYGNSIFEIYLLLVQVSNGTIYYMYNITY